MAYEGLIKIDGHPKTLGNLVNLTYNLAACQCADVYDAHLGKFLAYEDLLPAQEMKTIYKKQEDDTR